MTLLLTGAAGFLGAALTEALLARGERVIAVDRAPLGIARLLADTTYRPRCDLPAALVNVLAWIGPNSCTQLP